ncbi:Imidazole glycerol phosphate synthase amidotransferase subunit [Liberibacter crescens BT-1]|uniref:Imidazole glycerol phosphate synthase subunit HisH n=1 Tax=Liberibacter crescens (strain BT-1) TaxID=1215343 RepID=L0EWK2_LIBCB|nr:imidazole glycerol phosphate synthase subunit HisH [Liberibacter crescens]AGA65342.1 Imidazole glycerol phosphate synthase amidotransferase subunit [Liberibacter crescens BT-1]AMC12283.1 imidazole glycerol phosphate synthase [Liberibacter crescens]
MHVTVIDYGSGNLHSVIKAIERAALEASINVNVELTKRADVVIKSDRIILPGVGSYSDCRAGLDAIPDMVDTIREVVEVKQRPFLGICVGMQLMSFQGTEKTTTSGLGWIKGKVVKIQSDKYNLKIPQVGWNTLDLLQPHPLFKGISTGNNGLHAYFVHSYHLEAENPEDVIATTLYGEPVTAFVCHNNMAGAQFHPEKSQRLGLTMIANFLLWKI